MLRVETAITYVHHNEGGWTTSVGDTTCKVMSADIAGDWIGTRKSFSWAGRSELHISEIQEDGTVTATYKFIPEYAEYDSSGGSYELSGQWNAKTLTLFLEAGDWIDQPKYESFSNDKQNITAVLMVEDDQLEGRAQGNNYFEVR